MTTSTPPPAVPSRSLDHYARLVRRLLRVPTALVTLVSEHEQVFVGAAGLDERRDTTRRAPIAESFCRFVVSSGRPLVVSDARHDPELADHPGVTEVGVVAYLGWPLYDPEGRPVGSLCAIEPGPREWTPDEVSLVQDLADGCSAEVQRGSALTSLLEQLAALEAELGPSPVADRVAAIRRGAQ